MLAPLDRAASCELYGAEAKNGGTCSRASGHHNLPGQVGVDLMGNRTLSAAFSGSLGPKNWCIGGIGWVD
jgi:hypothetical protein